MDSSPEKTASPDTLVTLMEFSPEGQPIGLRTVARIVDDPSWKSRLSPQAYSVTRRHATDPPFAVDGYDSKEPGIYRCICCGTALFASGSKFDSGTGWPSFTSPLAKENIVTREDLSYGMRRVEVLCARCDAHMGHLFPDGPRPTGLRYCINMSALQFVPFPQNFTPKGRPE
ncbi:MAG: peptide-methionine (R)-S-oxide reductase MsrB [Leptospirillia bacterium]